MTRILVTGAAGQIGTDLVPELRRIYGAENVVAAIHKTPLAVDALNEGPTTDLDITNYAAITSILKSEQIDKIFHLSSVLSALAEKNRWTAYAVNISGVINILECALECGVSQVIIPSSIAAFGGRSPQTNTPNDTIQNPNTIYGISKVFGEQIGNYYHERFGLDVRGVRLPGIISWKTEPTSGTTDYAVAIFYAALRHGRYSCYLKADTRLPMMYMPDAVKSLIDLSVADGSRLIHHTDFNVHSMSFTPNELSQAIQKVMPSFEIEYEIDLLRQNIADSWPYSLDDSAARSEWDWKPSYGLEQMIDDMFTNLGRRLNLE